MLNRLLVAAAVSCILISSQSVARADLIYNWSFPAVGTSSGLVTGHVNLPDTGCDVDAGCAATAFFVDSNPLSSLANGLYPLEFALGNHFHLTSGEIDEATVVTMMSVTGSPIGVVAYAITLVIDGGLLNSIPTGEFALSTGPPTFSAVPGPIVGAGFPGLLIVAGGLVAWWRRKGFQSTRALNGATNQGRRTIASGRLSLFVVRCYSRDLSFATGPAS